MEDKWLGCTVGWTWGGGECVCVVEGCVVGECVCCEGVREDVWWGECVCCEGMREDIVWWGNVCCSGGRCDGNNMLKNRWKREGGVH